MTDHLLLAASIVVFIAGYLPEFVTITNGKTSDIEAGRALEFPKDSMVVIDRGNNDYAWYNHVD